MSREVQGMFAKIARRYDLANDVLSLGIHRWWRDRAVRSADIKVGQRVLDLCTGTGDQAFALARVVGQSGMVAGLDFVPDMLALAEQKSATRLNGNGAHPHFLQGDASVLPFRSELFDAVTISFGIRNVDDPLACLKEIYRVLRPGGRVMVLEFGRPRAPGFAQIYNLYSRYVMPQLGGALTGNRAAYEYLPRTAKAFPDGFDFLELLRRANFQCLEFKPLLSGLAYIYCAQR